MFWVIGYHDEDSISRLCTQDGKSCEFQTSEEACDFIRQNNITIYENTMLIHLIGDYILDEIPAKEALAA